MSKDRVLDLAEEFFLRARHRLPLEWLSTDLTMTQLKVLLTLHLDGPKSCGALAGAVGLSLPTMTGILTRLDHRGYLERRRDHNDARRVISGLSPVGREMIERLWAAGREGLADVLAAVAPDDLEAVERAMKILVDAVSASAGARKPLSTAHGTR